MIAPPRPGTSSRPSIADANAQRHHLPIVRPSSAPTNAVPFPAAQPPAQPPLLQAYPFRYPAVSRNPTSTLPPHVPLTSLQTPIQNTNIDMASSSFTRASQLGFHRPNIGPLGEAVFPTIFPDLDGTTRAPTPVSHVLDASNLPGDTRTAAGQMMIGLNAASATNPLGETVIHNLSVFCPSCQVLLTQLSRSIPGQARSLPILCNRCTPTLLRYFGTW